jgi:hypothetical protein
VRIWRALKSTHCGTLREGVYILPANANTAQAFWDMDIAIRDARAESHLLELQARDDKQEASFMALFDRSESYADFMQTLNDARKSFKAAAEPEIRKKLRDLDAQLQTILGADFFPGRAAESAKSSLKAMRHETERQLSPGEPGAVRGEITVLLASDYQGRNWATRTRPWVDRLATAWLVKRFIDKRPTFIWLAHDKKCPKSALGFDFDGATFTHVGERVTFEVMAATFELDKDPGIRRLGHLVHFVDAGGIHVDEAPGLELVVRGLHVQHADDDGLLAASMPIFDALYAGLRASE